MLYFLIRKLEQQRKVLMIAMNKLGKVWFHNTLSVKFHGLSIRNLKSLKRLFLDYFWVTASNV